MVRGWWFAALVGCGSGAAGLHPDVLNGELTPGSSLCEYEHAAPSFPPADADPAWAADWERSPYLACADGALSVQTTLFESGSGRSVEFAVDAQMFDVITPWEGGQAPGIVDPGTGLDDCAILRLDGPLVPVELGEVDFLDAPGVAVVVGGWQAPLEDIAPATSALTYSIHLAEGGIPEEVTEGHGPVALLVGEGGAAPAMELYDLTEVPEPLEVTLPRLTWGASVPRRATAFRWTGRGGTINVRLYARESYDEPSFPTYEVHCEVRDDGAWVMPAAVLEQLPAGWHARVEVERRTVAWMGTRGGDAIQTTARAAHVGAHLVLGD